MKKKLYIGFIVIMLFIFSFTQILDIDDMFCFTFAHNIKNGAVPYKDLNIFILPLYYCVNAFFLLFIDNLISFRILQFVLSLVSFYIIKKLIDGILPDKNNIYTSGILTLYFSCLKYNYNSYVIIFAMLSLIYLFLISNKKNIRNKDLFVLSTLGICGIFSKQTIGGIFYIAILLCIYILSCKIYSHKIAFKNVLKSVFICFIWTIILFSLFYFMGCFNEMLEFCFFGIFSFTKKQSSIYLPLFILFELLNVLWCILLYSKYKNVKYILFFIISTASLSIMYPLPNNCHIITATFLTVIFSCLFFIDFKQETKTKYYSYITKFVFYVFLFAWFGVCINEFAADEIILSQQKYIKGNLIKKEDEDEIVLLNEYIEKNNDKKYYIITEKAMMINSNRDCFNNFYDLFFAGNIGLNDPVEMIKEIENDYIIVYSDAKKDFFQIPDAALKYIRKLNKIDKIGNYTIYSKNKK